MAASGCIGGPQSSCSARPRTNVRCVGAEAACSMLKIARSTGRPDETTGRDRSPRSRRPGGRLAQERKRERLRTPGKSRFCCFLLFMLVNFADKISVGLAGVPIAERAEARAGAVRPARLRLLLPVLDLGHRCRLRRRSRVATRWGAVGVGGDLGAGAIPDNGNSRFSTLLICRVISGTGEGPAGCGGGARRLQMVPRREADAADRESVAGLPRSA